jgi:hypothetical protein
LSFKPSEAKKAVNKINADLQRSYEWACMNGLSMNVEKTKISDYPIKFIDKTLRFEENVRNLGAIIDENLTWTAHTNDIVKKVHFKLKHLSTFRNVLNEDVKKNLVNSIVAYF